MPEYRNAGTAPPKTSSQLTPLKPATAFFGTNSLLLEQHILLFVQRVDLLCEQVDLLAYKVDLLAQQVYFSARKVNFLTQQGHFLATKRRPFQATSRL